MDAKLNASLRSAASRFLWGILGTWCCLGPVIVLWSSAHWILNLVLALLLFGSYGYVYHICSRQGLAPIRKMIIEARSTICFMIIGLLISEMTGIFTRLKLELSTLYAFIGFFLAENYAHEINRIRLRVYDKLATFFQVIGIEPASNRGKDRKR
jgi:hypothetical protein